MNNTTRLEDLRRDWQAACEPLLEDCARSTLTRLPKACRWNAASSAQDNRPDVALIVDKEVGRWAEERLVRNCLEWLQEAGHWPSDKARQERAGLEVKAALQKLPRFVYEEPNPFVPVGSWAVTAAIGAALGTLIFSPLSLLVLGQREPGLFLGGILGSAGLVVLIGYLMNEPKWRKVLTVALPVLAAGGYIGGLWAFFRGRSTGWLRAALMLTVVTLLLRLTRPKLSSDIDAAQLPREIKQHLRHVADLVLAWCWSHPDRVDTGMSPVDGPPVCFASCVYDALANLRVDLDSADCEPENLRLSAGVLFQAFENDGYEWKSVPSGAPFSEEMQQEFDTFGKIEPGSTVRTRLPALLRQGQLIFRGKLRQIPSGRRG